MQASRHETNSVVGSSIPSQVGGNTGKPQMPQHGPHARGVSQVSTTSQQTPVTYDHNGNIVS